MTALRVAHEHQINPPKARYPRRLRPPYQRT